MKKIVLIFLPLFLLASGVGGWKFYHQIEKDRQIAFLKKNEEIILEKGFSKKKDTKFKWNTVKVEYEGFFAGPAKATGLTVEAYSTSRSTGKRYHYLVSIKTDVERLDTVESVSFSADGVWGKRMVVPVN